MLIFELFNMYTLNILEQLALSFWIFKEKCHVFCYTFFCLARGLHASIEFAECAQREINSFLNQLNVNKADVRLVSRHFSDLRNKWHFSLFSF